MNAIIGMIDLMRTDNLDEQQLSFFTGGDPQSMIKNVINSL
jgi:hypothetical protein